MITEIRYRDVYGLRYAHTLEVYFGQEDSFRLTGVHHVEPYERWMVNVTEAAHAVLLGIGVAAQILGMSAFKTEAIQMSDTWEAAADGYPWRMLGD